VSAAEKFQEAASSDSKDATTPLVWLARTYLHLHKLPDAQATVERALQSDKNSAQAQSAQAELDFRQAKITEAEALLRNLIQDKKADARAYLWMARIYGITANYKVAKTLLDMAHSLDPKDPDISAVWMNTLSRPERLVEFKKEYNEGKYENEVEQTELAEAIAVLQDREKNPDRSCKLVGKGVTTEITLRSLTYDAYRLRGYGLPVNVNGVSSNLLLDTGAGGILINSKTAEKAGLTKLSDQKIGGIGDSGPANGYSALAQKLKIGDLEFENCYVQVVDKKSSLNVDGLIGADVFADFLVDLNFPDHKMRLLQLPPFPDQPAQGASLQSPDAGAAKLHNRYIPPEFVGFEKAYRFGHMLLLQAKINDAPYKLFLLDTGDWDNTITPTAAREATKVHREYGADVRGLSGQVKKVYSTGAVTLAFSDFKQERDDMVSLDMTSISNNIGTGLSGTLGFAMLFQMEIWIDYRDHLVKFYYDPNRLH